jgi:hypothetical protein
MNPASALLLHVERKSHYPSRYVAQHGGDVAQQSFAVVDAHQYAHCVSDCLASGSGHVHRILIVMPSLAR